jgi:pantoate--beta-alanine ligase
MAKVIENIQDWLKIRESLRGKTIGFVPTMGALHAGHASLLEKSRAENDISVLSIYVNPTQFDNKNDLAKYPKTFEGDLELARTKSVDYVLLPTYEQIYPDSYHYKVSESEFSTQLCGAHRLGHFDGVLTVVMKLLNLVQAQKAYFGEKDHQQLTLIKGMAEAFFMPVQIIGCPTLREGDGLAMSSRNVRLTTEQRKRAPGFANALRAGKTASEAKSILERDGFEVDYIEDIGSRRYGAVKMGEVRLIDNVER